MNIQLDLFEDPLTETEILRKQLFAVNDRLDRQRKSLFAKNADIMKLVLKQNDEIDKLRELMTRRIK